MNFLRLCLCVLVLLFGSSVRVEAKKPRRIFQQQHVSCTLFWDKDGGGYVKIRSLKVHKITVRCQNATFYYRCKRVEEAAFEVLTPHFELEESCAESEELSVWEKLNLAWSVSADNAPDETTEFPPKMVLPSSVQLRFYCDL